MDIQELRKKIDGIDEQIVELFRKRLQVASEIAEYKKERNLPIYVPAREREKLHAVGELAGEEYCHFTKTLYSTIFELTRGYETKCNQVISPLYTQISNSIKNTPNLFPQSAMVACQGVEGAYSQIACEKIFRSPVISYCKTFEGVFAVIESGLCQYGILPLENSTAGSVNKVYDLMIHHNFSIVRTFRLKVDHCLLANHGATMASIKEIYSHEQAISQCAGFLNKFPNARIIPVENTAIASEMVAKSKSNEVAALSSRNCAELYDLSVLAQSVQDVGNNHTRFICISKNLEIYPGSDKTSIMMILPHRPGSLYKVLARLYTLGINVTKLESRPLPNRDFEFMFYFDLETSIYSEEYVQLMCELDDLCEEFKYLGSYCEVV